MHIAIYKPHVSEINAPKSKDTDWLNGYKNKSHIHAV